MAGVKGTVLVTVTHLQMTSPDQRAGAPGWTGGTTIRRAERPTVSFYRYLYDTVGTDGTQSCCLTLAWCWTRVQPVCTSIPSTEDAESVHQWCLGKNDAVSMNTCH